MKSVVASLSLLAVSWAAPAWAEDPPKEAMPAAAAAGEGEAAAGEGEGVDPEKAAFEAFLAGIDWRQGPDKGAVGDVAELQVPPGFRFAGAAGSKTLMERTGNLVNGREVGFIAPLGVDWFVVFEWDPSGYVKDDDKDKLDANALLESLKEGTRQANEERRERGLPTLEIIGWEVAPHYDDATKNLEWATRAQGPDGSLVVNHNTRILGRRGVMEATLVVSPDQLQAALPEAKRLMAGYGFTSGNRYAEFVQGDKVAEYGLAALILGGGAAAAAKSGLLAKLLKGGAKLVVLAGAGLVALIGKLKSMFSGKKDAAA